MLLKSRFRFRSIETIIGVALGLFDNFLKGEGMGGLCKRLVSLTGLVALERWLLLSHGEKFSVKGQEEVGDNKQIEIRGNMVPLSLGHGAASGTHMAKAKKHEIWSAWRGGNHAGTGV